MAGTSASTDNTSNRKNHLFHHANNDMNQNVVGIEQSRQQQLNEMLYGTNKERYGTEIASSLFTNAKFSRSRVFFIFVFLKFCVKFQLYNSLSASSSKSFFTSRGLIYIIFQSKKNTENNFLKP